MIKQDMSMKRRTKERFKLRTECLNKVECRLDRNDLFFCGETNLIASQINLFLSYEHVEY